MHESPRMHEEAAHQYQQHVQQQGCRQDCAGEDAMGVKVGLACELLPISLGDPIQSLCIVHNANCMSTSDDVREQSKCMVLTSRFESGGFIKGAGENC